MTGVCMDVTERHRLEEDRRSTHEMLGNLIATSPLGIISLDRDGHVLLWNEAAEAMYGWRADEALGRPLPTVPPDDWPELTRDLEAQFADRSQHRGTEIARRRRDGTPITIALWTSPLRDADGEIVANVSLQADTSERKLLEHQLAQSARLEALGSSRAASRTTSTTSSRSSSSYAALLRGSFSGDDARTEVDRDPRRRRAGRAPHPPAPRLRSQAGPEPDAPRRERRRRRSGSWSAASSAKTSSSSPSSARLGAGRADGTQLEQVVLNLCLNARDAMPDGGRDSAISTARGAASGLPRSEPALLRLRVADTGHGMNAETRERVFEPFFTTKPAGRGTGLGLATVYGIVSRAGAGPRRERARSRHVFSVSSAPEGPAAPGSPRRASERAAARLADRRRPHRPPRRGRAAGALRRRAHPPRRRLPRARGRRRARLSRDPATHVDALVTDVVMPGTSGRALAQAVNERHPELRVLYISGYSDEEIAARGILAPEMSFLQKPFTVDELETKLCELMEAPG